MRVIEAKSQVRKAQREFEREMKALPHKKGTITIGAPGFHGPREVSWFERLGIWWTTYLVENRAHEKRFENAFGVEEPKWETRYGHSIPCVIDVPFEGINRRIGGVYAVDDATNLYLLHRGRIGGGRMGIGKALFDENYRGERVRVQDGDMTLEMALVGELGGERLPYQVACFVNEVQRIKKQADTAKPEMEFPAGFSKEFSGKRKYSVGEVEAKCDHGLVVRSLENELRSDSIVTGNRRPLDLYVLDPDGQVSILFEVKTDTTPASCYEAVGQLLVYSAPFAKRPRLVAVFPDSLDRHYAGIFEKIGLRSLTYKWVKNEPIFEKRKVAELAGT